MATFLPHASHLPNMFPKYSQHFQASFEDLPSKTTAATTTTQKQQKQQAQKKEQEQHQHLPNIFQPLDSRSYYITLPYLYLYRFSAIISPHIPHTFSTLSPTSTFQVIHLRHQVLHLLQEHSAGRAAPRRPKQLCRALLSRAHARGQEICRRGNEEVPLPRQRDGR